MSADAEVARLRNDVLGHIFLFPIVALVLGTTLFVGGLTTFGIAELWDDDVEQICLIVCFASGGAVFVHFFVSYAVISHRYLGVRAEYLAEIDKESLAAGRNPLIDTSGLAAQKPVARLSETSLPTSAM